MRGRSPQAQLVDSHTYLLPPPQIRRYVYCDVVRTVDINAYIDVEGIQVRCFQSIALIIRSDGLP